MATADRIDRKPVRQFLGAGSDEITLTGEILPHFAGGYTKLDAMWSLSGRGQVPAEWGITGTQEEGSEFFADGDPGAITMTIAEYGGDRVASTSAHIIN